MQLVTRHIVELIDGKSSTGTGFFKGLGHDRCCWAVSPVHPCKGVRTQRVPALLCITMVLRFLVLVHRRAVRAWRAGSAAFSVTSTGSSSQHGGCASALQGMGFCGQCVVPTRPVVYRMRCSCSLASFGLMVSLGAGKK
jgi:DNA-binding transcriptional LysR family regulator